MSKRSNKQIAMDPKDQSTTNAIRASAHCSINLMRGTKPMFSPKMSGLMSHTGLSLLLTLLLSAPAAGQSMSVVDLNMTVGKSLVIDYPVEVGRISTSSPEVVDAVPATAKEFLLHGKGHGAATVVVWAKNGARTMYNVTVEHNTDPIKKLLAETFPGESIRVQSGRDSITLMGTVSTKEIADRAVAIATPLAKTVVSNLAIAAAPIEKQIILRVKFAELNRNKSAQFGVNLLSTGAGNTPGRITTGQFPAPTASRVSGTIGGQLAGTESTFTLSDALNIFAFRPDLNIGAVVRALQNEDVLQILAEPNLVTVNGKEANFLVGGEFPVPILQGGGNAGAVTIQFREFGIRLAFNPQITPNGTIKMYVKPEVSTIDLANSVTLTGFTIPALATRRMETNVELKEGQSFVVAGLMDDRVTDQMSRIPGLSSIPILGALFKSRLDRKSKSELIVLVTPEIVDADAPAKNVVEPQFPREFMAPSDLRKNSKNTTNSSETANSSLITKNQDRLLNSATKPETQNTSSLKKLKHLFFRSKNKGLELEPKAQPEPTTVLPSSLSLREASYPDAKTNSSSKQEANLRHNEPAITSDQIGKDALMTTLTAVMPTAPTNSDAYRP